MFKPTTSAKWFVIFSQPTLADPEWQVACADITDRDNQKLYSGFSELKKFIEEVEAERTRYAK